MFPKNTTIILSLVFVVTAPTRVHGCFLGSCLRPTNSITISPPSSSENGQDNQNQQTPQMYCQKLYEHTINDDQIINDQQYYGFLLADSSTTTTTTDGDENANTDSTSSSPATDGGRIGTFTLPVYDNLELSGQPVARLRGNMITSQDGADFLATATFEFFDDQTDRINDEEPQQTPEEDSQQDTSKATAGASTMMMNKSLLGVHVSYSYRPGDEGFVYGYTTGGTGRFVPTQYNANVESVVVATEPNFIVEWTFCSSTSTTKLVL